MISAAIPVFQRKRKWQHEEEPTESDPVGSIIGELRDDRVEVCDLACMGWLQRNGYGNAKFSRHQDFNFLSLKIPLELEKFAGQRKIALPTGSVTVTEYDSIAGLKTEWRKKSLESSSSNVETEQNSDSEQIQLEDEKNSEAVDQSLGDVDVPKTLMMLFEEVLFLVTKNQMEVVRTSEKLTGDQLWQHACEMNSLFPYLFAVFCHYKRKGWVVRSGLQFGVDYLLYKIGPAYYHASYGVRVMYGESWQNLVAWPTLTKAVRSLHHVAKELLICHVRQQNATKDLDLSSIDCLNAFSIQEMIVNQRFSNRMKIDNN